MIDILNLLDFEILKAILLEALIENTYLILAVTALIAAIGVPLAESLLVISAGAFAAQGMVEFHIVVLITFIMATAGDNVGYFIGRKIFFFNRWIPEFAKEYINVDGGKIGKHEGKTIFLSRFLFTALGPPINILSGIKKINHKKFLLYGSFGELIWALEMTTLGYFFGVHVEEVFDIVNNAIIILILVLAIAWLYNKSK